MRFKIDKNEFGNALAYVGGIAERKSTMPILSNVLIKAEGNVVKCVATDLGISVYCVLDATVTDPGIITVSAKSILDIVKSISSKDVDIESTENNYLNINGGNAKFKIVALSGDEYPSVPVIPESGFKNIKCSVLNEMISKTYFSILNGESHRPAISCGLLEYADGKLRMVSIDGHRLSIVDHENIDLAISKQTLVPRKSILEIKRIFNAQDADCEIAIVDNVMFLRAKNITMATRLLDTHYPEYGAIIPKEFKRQITVKRDDLRGALKRVLIVSQDSKATSISLTSGLLVISCESESVGQGKEEIYIDYDLEDFEIKYNGSYLLDAISCIEDDYVCIGLNEHDQPCVIKSNDNDSFISVIMPMLT